jgi:hypothetical protein
MPQAVAPRQNQASWKMEIPAYKQRAFALEEGGRENNFDTTQDPRGPRERRDRAAPNEPHRNQGDNATAPRARVPA